MTYKRGIVREVDAKTARARVEFEDADNMSSFWLSVNMSGAGKSKVYSMPDVNSQVNCLMDERGEEGTIIGAIYSDEDKPPVEDENHVHMALEGGSTIDYDRTSGTLQINLAGEAQITAGKTIIIKAASGVTVQSGGSSIELKPNGIILNADNFTVNAPTVFTKGFTASGGAGATIEGNVKIDGEVKATQRIESDTEVKAPKLSGNLT